MVFEQPQFGVYVHVPFCAARCDYCDFATWTDRMHLVDDYVDACVLDLESRAAAGAVPVATSVFFGGGTPSLLPADRVARILGAIRRTPGAEVTVECNPDSVDESKLAGYRAAGVTRVSFGVQSMRVPVLAALGRTHDPANVARAVAAARVAGFETFNLDLIYGADGETLDDWRATLDAVLALDPPHVSAYALTVEPATPLGRRVAAGAAPPDDDEQATKYELADERLAAAGFSWYELSNWARPGHECRHNLLYWSQGDYLGIGCAAHGHTTEPDGSARRWWNVRTPECYIAAVTAGSSPVAAEERLDPAARAEERLTLALRTRGGATVPRTAAAVAGDLEDLGLVEATAAGVGPGPGRIRLTRRGRLLANDVTARVLLAAGPPYGGGGSYGAPSGTRYTRVPTESVPGPGVGHPALSLGARRADTPVPGRSAASDPSDPTSHRPGE
jgi:putative oxygen-independent coproporphyrinogen III oxidase